MHTGRRVGAVAAILGIALAALAGALWLGRATRPSAADVAEAYAAALRDHDAPAMVDLYGHPFVYEDPGLGMHLTTREQIHDWYWNVFQPSVRFRVGAIVAGPETTMVEWRWTGLRVWSDGEPYAIRGVSVLEIVDGHITRQVVCYDPSPFSGQGGPSP